MICLAMLGGVVFIKTLDLNLYKENIQQLVFERTGRSLSIDGEIDVQVFPWVGLQLNDATLENAVGFDDAPFASIRASDVQLELLPLVSGNVSVKWVQLHGLKLNLQVNQDGVANWEDLLNTTTVVETETGQDDVLQAVEAGAPLAAALSVGGIEITDAMISWIDEQAAADLTVTKLNLNTDAIQLGQPFEFNTSFDASSQRWQASTGVQASGALAIDLASNSYRLQNLALQTVSTSAGLPVEQLEVGLAGDLLINFRAQTLDLTQLNLMLEQVPFTGELHGTGIFESPSFFGEFSSESFNAAALIRELGAELPETFDDSLLSNSRIEFGFQQTEEQILLNGLQLSSADAVLSGDFQVSNLAQSPVLSGKLSSNAFNPSMWLSALAGWSAADPLVMQQAKLSMAVRQSGQILSLNDVQINLDDFALTGNVEVTDINAATPPLVFELYGTRLDVERYMPVAEITENEALPRDTVNDDNLPIELLSALDINGLISFEELSFAGVTVTDIAIPINASQGLLEVSEAKAALYGGSLFNSASLDLNTDPPLLKWSSNISAVQSDTLLSDYLKSPSPVSGTGIMNIDMLTRGIKPALWMEQADGAISLRFTDGAINGVNIAQEIRQASAMLQGESLSAGAGTSTDFTELSVSGEINDGILRSDDLSLKAPLLRVSGKGELDIRSQQVDYLATVLITDETQGQGGAEMSALQGLSLPLPVSGTLSDLSVDFAGMLVNALTADFSTLFNQYKKITLSEQQQKIKDAATAQQEQIVEVIQEQRESAEVLLEENKEVVIEQILETQQQVEQVVEEQVGDIKNEAQKKIEQGILDLLEK